ncbi:amidohydrolase family protein [Fusarium sporotrichioides]|uniref:Amidohydrolase family protein n=1 Tax=Fusarium sporotrichioides TaxID=5514 RepID=A0A395RRT8_FUSSP|nr:amidohydrolase family protein [Fusarium sporotrichioides]
MDLLPTVVIPRNNICSRFDTLLQYTIRVFSYLATICHVSHPRIDVHHDIIPPQLQGVAAGLKGMEVPNWTVDSDTAFNNTYNIGSAIYSASTPGVTHIAVVFVHPINNVSAVHLQQSPDVKMIFSHGGGTLIALIQPATMVPLPEFALAGSKEVFPMILEFAKPGHLLFGSDCPHPPEQLSKCFTNFVDEFPMDEEGKREIYDKAALELFPRLNDSYRT